MQLGAFSHALRPTSPPQPPSSEPDPAAVPSVARSAMLPGCGVGRVAADMPGSPVRGRFILVLS